MTRKIVAFFYIALYFTPLVLAYTKGIWSLYILIGYILTSYLAVSIIVSRSIPAYINEIYPGISVLKFLDKYLLPCLFYFNILLYGWPLVAIYAVTKFIQYHFVELSFDLGSFARYMVAVDRVIDFNNIFPVGSEIKFMTDNGERTIKIEYRAAVTGTTPAIIIDNHVYSIQMDENYIKGKTNNKLKYKLNPFAMSFDKLSSNIKKDLGYKR